MLNDERKQIWLTSAFIIHHSDFDSPGQFHLSNNLLGELLDRLLLGGNEGLAAFGNEVGLLA